jgi:ATP-dependent Zn protease
MSVIDDEISAIMKNGLRRAREIIEKNRQALDSLSLELIKKETLEREEYEILLKKYGVEMKDVKRGTVSESKEEHKEKETESEKTVDEK